MTSTTKRTDTYRVIGIDPGGVNGDTGVAVLDSNLKLIYAGIANDIDTINNVINSAKDLDVIILEDYNPIQNDKKQAYEVYTKIKQMEIFIDIKKDECAIGYLKKYSSNKSFLPKGIVKKLGYQLPVTHHKDCESALEHCLAYLIRTDFKINKRITKELYG